MTKKQKLTIAIIAIIVSFVLIRNWSKRKQLDSCIKTAKANASVSVKKYHTIKEFELVRKLRNDQINLCFKLYK